MLLCSFAIARSASAIADADSSSAAGRSRRKMRATIMRTKKPPHVPIIAPPAPKMIPPATGSSIATAAVAPTSAPTTTRTNAGPGSVRLGVLGNVSTTYSPSAKTVKMITTKRCAAHVAHPRSGTTPSHTAQVRAAMAVMLRMPVTTPSNKTISMRSVRSDTTRLIAQPAVEWELLRQLADAAADRPQSRLVGAVFQRFRDPARDGPHLRLLHATCRQRRGADADAARLQRRIRVVRNRVLIHCDFGDAQRGLSFRAQHATPEDIYQHNVRIRSAGDHSVARSLHGLSQRLRVRNYLRRVGPELRLQRFAEGNRLRRDNVHQRSTLLAREDTAINTSSELLLAENQSRARPTQRFVRRRSHHMRVRHGRRMHTTRD